MKTRSLPTREIYWKTPIARSKLSYIFSCLPVSEKNMIMRLVNAFHWDCRLLSSFKSSSPSYQSQLSRCPNYCPSYYNPVVFLLTESVSFSLFTMNRFKEGKRFSPAQLRRCNRIAHNRARRALRVARDGLTALRDPRTLTQLLVETFKVKLRNKSWILACQTSFIFCLFSISDGTELCSDRKIQRQFLTPLSNNPWIV